MHNASFSLELLNNQIILLLFIKDSDIYLN
jgi:hypothetical protein